MTPAPQFTPDQRAYLADKIINAFAPAHNILCFLETAHKQGSIDATVSPELVAAAKSRLQEAALFIRALGKPQASPEHCPHKKELTCWHVDNLKSPLCQADCCPFGTRYFPERKESTNEV
ncbi:MAG: hypothetical protein M0Z52_03930 [Actinomycetota bacterium]|nr:hypothetical protein [Actinomycetota bacterium]